MHSSGSVQATWYPPSLRPHRSCPSAQGWNLSEMPTLHGLQGRYCWCAPEARRTLAAVPLGLTARSDVLVGIF